MEVNMLNQACSTLGLAVLLAAVGIVPAHTQTKRTAPDEYTGTTADMTQGSGSKLSFQILQWSSEGDRERVLSVIGNASKEKNDQPDLAKALEALPTVGYIWATGPLGYSLKYAHRVTLPDGASELW